MQELGAPVFVDEHFTRWLPVLCYALELQAVYDLRIGVDHKYLTAKEYFRVFAKSQSRGLLHPNDPLGSRYFEDDVHYVALPLFHLAKCIVDWFSHEISQHPGLDVVNRALISTHISLVRLFYAMDSDFSGNLNLSRLALLEAIQPEYPWPEMGGVSDFGSEFLLPDWIIQQYHDSIGLW